MPRTWICPFFVTERKGLIFCEQGKLRFQNHAEFSAFACRYCANIDGWKKCTLSQFCAEKFEKSEDQK